MSRDDMEITGGQQHREVDPGLLESLFDTETQRKRPEKLKSKSIRQLESKPKLAEQLKPKVQERIIRKDEVMTEEELNLKYETDISRRLDENKRILEERVGLGQSFDVMFREMTFGEKRTGIFYINGFAKDTILTDLILRLSYLSKKELVPNTLKNLMEKYIAHIQVETVNDMKETIDKVLAGMVAIFIDQEHTALIVDAKQYPVRGLEEPTLEKVVRGSRDGFNETLLTNVTLVRRRLRDPRLKFEMTKIGRRTQTDVCIGYIHDIADMDLVDAISNKMSKVDMDGIPLAEKQLEEILIDKKWNPYPIVRYSERPDVIAAHMLEGHVVIFADTSPSVMILPTTFFHHVQHAEEYRQAPFIGSYLRWVRFFGIFASLFLLPLWFLLVTEPQLKPAAMDFIGPKEQGELPLLLQFVIVEIGVDLMRLAAVHTPTPLATAMGLIAAILIGDIAVQTGLFVNEVILYMAVATIGMFATPSYELGLANRVVRLFLLVAVALFKVPGLMIGSALFVIYLAVQRSYNTPYLWPFIPFDMKALAAILVRRPVQRMKRRPSITKSYDDTRQPQT